MTLKCVTFKTNHTIMGDVESPIGSETISIKKTVQVVSVPAQGNQGGGVAFAPFVEYTEEFNTGFKIQKSDILFMSTPVTELENQYNQIFGAGIQIAHSIPSR